MPVVAVVGGIATAAGAASGAAALVGGAFTMANVAAGLAFVGGVTTALGGLTGNKKLMKIGAIASIGGLAVGGLSSLADAAGNAASSGTGMTAAPGGLGVKPSGAVWSDVGGAQNTTGLLGGADVGQNLAPGIGESLGGLDTGVSGLSGVSSAAAPAQQAAQASSVNSLRASAAAVQPTSSFAASAGDVMSSAGTGLRISPDVMRIGTLGEKSGGGMLSGFGKFLGDNKELVKAGTDALGGMGQGYMAQKKLQEEERMANEQRARLNASILGQSQRY